MAALDMGGKILLIDAGLSFPEVEMPGIDLVLPNWQFLRDNANRVQGVVLTHGHEDHMGSLPYLLREFDLAIYGTKLTLALLEGKLEEHGVRDRADFHEVTPGEEVRARPVHHALLPGLPFDPRWVRDRHRPPERRSCSRVQKLNGGAGLRSTRVATPKEGPVR